MKRFTLIVLGLTFTGFIGCKAIPPKTVTQKGDDGLTYTFINSGTDSPGKVMKGIVITDDRGHIVNSAFTDSPKLKEAVIAGAAQGAPVVVATAIGGYFYKEGQRARRPDSTNISMSNANDADSMGNIGGGAGAFAGAKAFSEADAYSKSSAIAKPIQRQSQSQKQEFPDPVKSGFDGVGGIIDDVGSIFD